MAKWDQKAHRLKENHGWKAKPGYKIFVADRGAVRLDFPEDWIVEPGTDSVKFHDRPPPDDDCLLQVSIIHLPPAIDWSSLPLTQLLEAAIESDSRGVVPGGEVTHVRRPGLELARTEARFTDALEQREACSRTCLARGANIQPLITLDYWPEDSERVVPVWDEVLRSLQLGDYIKDPTRRDLN